MPFRDVAKYCQNRPNKEYKNRVSYLLNSLMALVKIRYTWRNISVAIIETVP